MKNPFILFMLVSVCRLYALSSDDFIVQDSNTPNRHRAKFYLGQVWENIEIYDNLIKEERHDNWSGYKNVVIYYYENIEIVTAKLASNNEFHSIVEINITGEKYSTMAEITVGKYIEDIILAYGEPKHTIESGGIKYFVYQIFDPHSDWEDVLLYTMNFICKNNIIERIIVYYVYNI